MEPLLYLVHRIPYPPNKGDKIRSYHLLKYLSERYDVYLGTFVDSPEDWQYLDILSNLCKEVFVRGINPRSAKIKSIKGLFTGQAMTIPYYHQPAMQRWVNRTIEQNSITTAMVFSSSMGQYLQGDKYSTLTKIIDFVDMDSDKWKQYSQSKTWPMSWIYKREGEYLLRFELDVAKRFHKSLFVSHAEATLFRRSAVNFPDKVDYYNNGVDAGYFSPDSTQENPYHSIDGPIYVFTGAMDYWANADAAIWFVNKVFNKIRAKFSSAKFYIVGSKPTPELVRIGAQTGVTVTGFVDDIRPYIQFADVVVAPLQIARGVQNKVLEAMSMAKIVVATSAAIEGIDLTSGYQPRISDSASGYAKACVDAINSKRNADPQGRQCVLENYNWENNLRKLDGLLR